MKVYFGKDAQAANEAITATNGTVRCLTGRVEESERNTSTENFFSSISFYDDRATLKTSYCSTAHPASCHGPFNPDDSAPHNIECDG